MVALVTQHTVQSLKGSGFDWTDAGIGLAAGLAIALVVLGVTLVVRELIRSNRSAMQPTHRRDQP
jgi:uncharacterized membrane protein YhiD involved in acid resistance